MSSGLNMSLDDLIKQSKSRPKANPAFSSGPTRRAAPSARTMPYPPSAPKAATADSLYGVYSEHVAAMATSPPPPVAGPQALETGTKLHISNLDSSVTVEDVQELFSEIGELKRYSVNYDKDGKSQGSAEVVFARKVDALDAIERYNGVLLDGKPMKIELIGNKTEPHPTEPLMYNGTSSNYNATPNSLLQRGDPRGPFHGNGRSGGSGQGGAGKRGMFQGNVRPGNTVQDGGGRGQGRARGHDRSRVPASAADLDAELEQYHAAAVKQK
ncbi:unnamed protein product [Triticum aestivum]|uniref:RRM domain-containing protein n=3 Tax=Triticinae TaxID=1648030 RepID=A0A9R1JG37_WHEAT|nr:THO complex subunit 4B [Aegilops tauschii subsp. strangulata]XP_044331986.1 THO complex subunit 4B-like [Triticum aestivum]KAF7015699.1 hypothetical protein CFC21_029471 [Triticum aestivum]SPT17737.1 unnamed protein product [Triticum aestivum]